MDVQGPIAIVTAGELFGGVERHVLGLGAFLQRARPAAAGGPLP